MKPDYTAIGTRLKEARNSKGITQQQLADIMGVSVSYVKNTERGGKPSIEYLLVVANECQVSTDWLLIGVQSIPAEQGTSQATTQKIEAIFDPDLKDMMDVLKSLMENGDSDLRGWAKIQFKNAFKEHCAAVEEKKHHA